VKADEERRDARCGACLQRAALSQLGQHGIGQINKHQHPPVWIEAAPGQTNDLASSAGHHAETQHYRPAGARTGLAAPRRPSLVVQKICRLAGAIDDHDLAGTTSSPLRRGNMQASEEIKNPDAGSLVRATNVILQSAQDR